MFSGTPIFKQIVVMLLCAKLGNLDSEPYIFVPRSTQSMNDNLLGHALGPGGNRPEYPMVGIPNVRNTQCPEYPHQLRRWV